MTSTRLLIWPMLAACYGSVLAAAFHTLFRTWSGAASLGMAFTVFVGTPTLLGYAGFLWRKNMLIGFARIEAALCILLPLSVLAIVLLAILLGR